MAASKSPHKKCSVLGCCKSHQNLFNLPRDQHVRSVWVTFILHGPPPESLPQHLYVCALHFTSDCFENEGAYNAGFASRLLLKKGSIPTVRHPHAVTSKTKEVACQTEAPLRSVGTQLSRRTLDANVRSKSTQTTVLTRDIGVGTVRASRQASQESTTMNRSSKRQRLDWEEDHDPLEGSGSELTADTYNRCPFCGPESDLETSPHGSPIISNHQCLQCEDRNQWKSQVNGRVPATSDKHLTDDTSLAAEAASTKNKHGIVTDVPEIVAVIDEERDDVDEINESVEDDMDSHEDWDLKEAIKLDDEYSEESDYNNSDLKCYQLCPDCGVFCLKLWRHTCEYKLKPYSCNFCGKRCVSEAALSLHDKIHSEDYEHWCKYCNVTFKSKRDKIIHEKIHVNDTSVTLQVF